MITRHVRSVVALALAAASLSLVAMPSHVSAGSEIVNEIVPVGDNFRVFITPAFGKYPKPLPVTMTPAEIRVIKNTQRVVAPIPRKVPATRRVVKWFIEPSAVDSRTLKLARRSLEATQILFEAIGIYDAQATSIVVGRTQKYISNTLATLGCVPNLTATAGQFLMAASRCNDSVIVLNLTGMLFLTSASQKITAEMESRPEPLMASMNYLVVDRNISALSHEWAHSVRALMSGGHVPIGEPAWMREGFAELIAGLSRVKAFPLAMQYSDFHAIKLHLFTNWQSRCQGQLIEYKFVTELGGCEYEIGLMAVELLLSDFGGLTKLMQLYRDTRVLVDFEASFQTNYGISWADFKVLAQKYIDDIDAIPFRT